MGVIKFFYGLSIFLVVVLFSLICIFGLLNEFSITANWVNNNFDPLSTWQIRGLYVLGLVGIVTIIVGWFLRVKGSIQSRRSSAVKIQEDGGTTWILETAINRYLQSMLKQVEGVESTNTTTAMSHSGAVTVEVNVLSRGIRSRPDLSREVREITRKALVENMGIAQVESINIVHQDYKYVESAAPVPAQLPAPEPEPATAVEATPIEAEVEAEPEPKKRGWFGRGSEEKAEEPEEAETPAEEPEKDPAPFPLSELSTSAEDDDLDETPAEDIELETDEQKKDS